MALADEPALEAVAAADGSSASDLLRAPEAGGRVIRGGAVRGVGFGISTVLGLATAAILLNYLNVDDFGRYATVTALLGIVAGITDAGLTAVGSREISVSRRASERAELLNNLLVLRLLGASLGVLAAIGFSIVAGYPAVVVAGTAIGGLGVILLSAQAMLTVPIWVELRIVSLTALEVLRNLLTLVAIGALALAGAGLVAFFGIQIAVAVVLIPVTLLVARVGVRLTRGVRRDLVLRLLRETLPLAVAFALSVIYFRVLVVIVSLVSTELQTGLFGTSFRVFEMLLALPALILSVALPLLSVAGDEDDERLRHVLQNMTEASLLIAGLLVIGVAILAGPAIDLIATSEYSGAASVLRIQAIALIPLFLTQTFQLGLIAGRAQRAMAIANGLALVLVIVLGLVFVPGGGAKAAAWVAVAAEGALALFLWVSLRRMRPGGAPRFAFAWKIVVAMALGGAAGYLLRDIPLVAAAAAVAVYSAAAFVTRAVPADAYHALGLMRSKEAA